MKQCINTQQTQKNNGHGSEIERNMGNGQIENKIQFSHSLFNRRSGNAEGSAVRVQMTMGTGLPGSDGTVEG